jgi:hypothetical protein
MEQNHFKDGVVLWFHSSGIAARFQVIVQKENAYFLKKIHHVLFGNDHPI